MTFWLLQLLVCTHFCLALMAPQEHAQFQARHYQMSRDVTSKTAARKNTEPISHFKKESGSGHLKQLRVRVFTLKHQFHNQSDGSLTSNKSNGFCFFPTLHPKQLLWDYVSLVSAYKIQRKAQIALWQPATNAHIQLCTVITTVIYIHRPRYWVHLLNGSISANHMAATQCI